MTDIASGDQLLDPLFTWSPVFGASNYEMEVSTSQDFAASSRVLDIQTTATSYSPTSLLQDNEYFWRVRPFDSPATRGRRRSVRRSRRRSTTCRRCRRAVDHRRAHARHVRHRLDPSVTPVIEWDPVMGASSYQLEIDAVHGRVRRVDASPSTRPSHRVGADGHGSGGAGVRQQRRARARTGNPLLPGSSYCVKIRAVDTDAEGNSVFGDWTFVNNYPSPLFTYTGGTPATTAPCNGALLECAANYVEPANGAVETSTPPVFVWKPVTGAAGYYIVISKDPNFTNILDYAYTNQTTYTPRDRTYADETSPIYWAVLPTSGSSGTGYPNSGSLATLGGKRTFTKQSVPPVVSTA